ncbi:hypothetical protein JAAARDRAFT_133573 [Jaapia argillacea MUCL 33604]|uniref:Protein kinase domain-containing protein n=1 Tax=Jaapia argillacea MUCL 33604 TaxID=933084 RepID=A0A067PLP5_9AGAM|nr:hypothetical protein JAAARDRAFT_133573 [Jaapia argillacea MUCL 33604]
MATERPRSTTPTEQLISYETYWRDHQKWLADQGYLLRPRYMPDWVPSWRTSKKHRYFCEDFYHFQVSQFRQFIDATRSSDGALVALKRVSKSIHPFEVDIAKYLSSDPLSSDPHNHCVPVIEVLQVPDDEDTLLLVMPFLRPFDDPRFDTVGEAVAFFQQVFQGLQFLHSHFVAHRDNNEMNIMLDPTNLYPDSFHPVRQERKRNYKRGAKYYTRTQRPPKYYFIDFGISRRYKPEDMPPNEEIIVGGDSSAPEFQEANMDRTNDMCNPFPTDIYYLGNMIRQNFIQNRYGFEFMEPLVADMVQDDPSKRPTIDEAMTRFTEIRNSLSSWKLRSRVVEKEDVAFYGFFRAIAHWRRRIWFILRRVPAVPLPP